MGYGKQLSTPATNADRQHKRQILHTLVDWTECEDRARRDRLERNPEAWLKWYCGETFTRPFEIPHRAIIGGAMNAIRTGGRFAVAGERGIGKSAVLWGVVLMLALSGETAFPVCLPWDARAQKRALRFWKNALCFNDRIGADYPEICKPFRHSRGVSQRLMATVWKVDEKYRGQPGVPEDGQETGASLAVSGGLIVLPDDRGCIGGATINGGCRGLNHPTRNGGILRPSLVLLDDVQDRKVARSAALVSETVSKIDSDVAAMGEAGTNLPMLMSGNCIVRDDVMEQYLSDDRWESARIPCVQAWPDKWDEGKGEAFKLWQEWHGLYQAGKGAVTFYRHNKAAMTRGMVLTAPSAFRKGKGLPDAFCGAMLAYFKMGPEAFAAEKQQAPLKQGVTVYTITPQVICSRVMDREPGEVPADVVQIVAAVDVNPSYALTWGAIGYASAVAYVLDYGRDPISVGKDVPEQEAARTVYDALVATLRRLAGKPYRVNLMLFDLRGWNYDAAYNLSAMATRLTGVPTIGAMGYGAKTYKPSYRNAGGRSGNNWHSVTDTKRRQYIAYNADHWAEVSQKAWLGEIGSPGSCNLPRGDHREWAQQICREQLRDKHETQMGMRWEWATAPGAHDAADVMKMCAVGADVQGVWTGNGQIQKRQHRTHKGPRVSVIPI